MSLYRASVFLNKLLFQKVFQFLPKPSPYLSQIIITIPLQQTQFLFSWVIDTFHVDLKSLEKTSRLALFQLWSFLPNNTFPIKSLSNCWKTEILSHIHNCLLLLVSLFNTLERTRTCMLFRTSPVSFCCPFAMLLSGLLLLSSAILFSLTDGHPRVSSVRLVDASKLYERLYQRPAVC